MLWYCRWVRAVPGSAVLTSPPRNHWGHIHYPGWGTVQCGVADLSARWWNTTPIYQGVWNAAEKLEGDSGWQGKAKYPPNTRHLTAQQAILHGRKKTVGWQSSLLFSVDEIVEQWGQRSQSTLQHVKVHSVTACVLDTSILKCFTTISVLCIPTAPSVSSSTPLLWPIFWR